MILPVPHSSIRIRIHVSPADVTNVRICASILAMGGNVLCLLNILGCRKILGIATRIDRILLLIL